MPTVEDLRAQRDRADAAVRQHGGDAEATALAKFFAELHTAGQVNVTTDAARDAARASLDAADDAKNEVDGALLSSYVPFTSHVGLAATGWYEALAQAETFYEYAKDDYAAFLPVLKRDPAALVEPDGEVALAAHITALRFFLVARDTSESMARAEENVRAAQEDDVGVGAVLVAAVGIVTDVVVAAIDLIAKVGIAVVKAGGRIVTEAAKAIIPTWLWWALGGLGVVAVTGVVLSLRRGIPQEYVRRRYGIGSAGRRGFANPATPRTMLDRILDRVECGRREATLDTEGYTSEQVARVIAAARSRGLHVSGTHRWLLIRG